MTSNPNEARARAEARLELARQKALEGEKVWAERDAKARAVQENTLRLRALRLARDEAEKAAPPAPKAKPPR